MASKATVKNRQPKKTNARATKTATASATNNRAHASTRSPIEALTQMCAQQANRSKGQVQQEWFALGSWVAQFRGIQQAESTAATTEVPRVMAASA